MLSSSTILLYFVILILSHVIVVVVIANFGNAEVGIHYSTGEIYSKWNLLSPIHLSKIEIPKKLLQIVELPKSRVVIPEQLHISLLPVGYLCYKV